MTTRRRLTAARACAVFARERTLATLDPMANVRVAPRERLLKAAHLFYNEGINNVGIKRVLESAETPIMSLYRQFGSKDGPVQEYLERRDRRVGEKFLLEVAERASSGRDKILAMFDVLGEVFEDDHYRGCAFINASVEMASHEHPLTQLAISHKDAVRAIFAGYAAEAGVPNPAGLAVQLQLLMDGAFVGADMRKDPSLAAEARAAAEALVDRALAESGGRRGEAEPGQPRGGF